MSSDRTVRLLPRENCCVTHVMAKSAQNIGNARTAGFERDVGLEGYEYVSPLSLFTRYL